MFEFEISPYSISNIEDRVFPVIDPETGKPEPPRYFVSYLEMPIGDSYTYEGAKEIVEKHKKE